MDKLMKVKLDFFEMYYLLESCFRGSHLRSDTIERFVDEWYDKFTPEERNNLYEWILRDIYNGKFEPNSVLCGADIVFMARYNPDNQYSVTLKGGGKGFKAFFRDGKYYINSTTYIDNASILKVRKLDAIKPLH